MNLHKFQNGVTKLKENCFYILYIPNYCESDHVIARYIKGKLISETRGMEMEKDKIKKYAKLETI